MALDRSKWKNIIHIADPTHLEQSFDDNDDANHVVFVKRNIAKGVVLNVYADNMVIIGNDGEEIKKQKVYCDWVWS